MSTKVLSMCCLLTLEKSPAARTVMITALLEYCQFKQIVFCDTFHRVSHVCGIVCASCMLRQRLSPPQRRTFSSQAHEVYASVETLGIFVYSLIGVIDFSRLIVHKRTRSYSLWSTLFFWAWVLNNHSDMVANGVNACPGQKVTSARIRALLSQLDRVFVWQVSPFSYFLCFLDWSPLTYLLCTFLNFSCLCRLPLCHPLVLTLTFLFYVCVYCRLLSAVHFPWCI